MNGYKYRCNGNSSCSSVTSSEAVLYINPPSASSIHITSNMPVACAGSPVIFTAVPVNGGSAPAYQWKKNSINVGTNASTYTDNALVNGDVISCVLTSNSTCTTDPVVTSNVINMVVQIPVTPSVSITASANNVCSGIPVTFTASPVNAGGAAIYEWLKNGVTVASSNSNLYTDNALVNGDVIKCIIYPSLTCITAANAESNSVTMVIKTTSTYNFTIKTAFADIVQANPIPLLPTRSRRVQAFTNGKRMAAT